MQPDVDVIIVGGGCAGLSLAAHLALLGPDAPRTLILEPRDHYTHDRTWSGWRMRNHLFLDCVRASWSRWALSHDQKTIVRGNGQHVYDTIPADRFYAAGLRAIGAAPRIQLHAGTTAYATGQDGDIAWVDTDRGRLHARLVVDTRPGAVQPGIGMLQTFAGLEIQTSRPYFDAKTVGLMAFEAQDAASSQKAVTFLYTLPFSATHALLEWTHLSPAPHPPPPQAALAALLRDRLGCDFTVLRTEQGCLPMQPAPRRAAWPPRVLYLGTPAGALRASTGYGFATIQQQAEALARVLRHGPAAAMAWRAAQPPAWMRGMDRLFLRVLRHDPRTGPALFTTLFRRCPSAPLLRFLTGNGSLLDGGLVALSMPKAPFLRALTGAALTSAPLTGPMSGGALAGTRT
jgi:lycopene beta-cyclase